MHVLVCVIKWMQHVWQMDRDRLPNLFMKYQRCGNRSQGRGLEDF